MITKADICEALHVQCNIATSTSDQMNRRNGHRGTQVAYIKHSAEEASKALKIPKIRIGWVSYRMSELKSKDNTSELGWITDTNNKPLIIVKSADQIQNKSSQALNAIAG